MRFLNLKTGNYVSSENPVTIKLMQESDNYEAVNEAVQKPAGKSGVKAKGASAGKQ